MLLIIKDWGQRFYYLFPCSKDVDTDVYTQPSEVMSFGKLKLCPHFHISNQLHLKSRSNIHT